MTGRPQSRWHGRSWAAVIAGLALLASACSGAGGGGGGGGSGGTVTVATVANPQMQDIEKLSSTFEKETGINVKFVILPENELRDRVTQDIATKAGQYDVVTIGTYEVPIWAKNGWIENLAPYTQKDSAYDANDLIPTVSKALSYQNNLHAVPFYGESS